MTTTTTTTPDGAGLRRVAPAGARTAGLLYLGIAVTGMLGYLLVRPVIVDALDAAATLELVREHELLARAGVALDLGLVTFQALAALAFFRLLRTVDGLQAGALAVFGTVNAVVILVGAGAMLTAVTVATGGVVVPDPAGATQLLLAVSAAMWDVGCLFFGLWLVPMGLLARRADWMPDALGTVLVVGGVGYVLSALTFALLPDGRAVADVLVIPATIGELWMIGHLLSRRAAR